MSDVALSGVFLGRGALSREVAQRLQLKQVGPEVDLAVGGEGRHDRGGGGGRALDAVC
jgi:hypothetical protein